MDYFPDEARLMMLQARDYTDLVQDGSFQGQVLREAGNIASHPELYMQYTPEELTDMAETVSVLLENPNLIND